MVPTDPVPIIVAVYGTQLPSTSFFTFPLEIVTTSGRVTVKVGEACRDITGKMSRMWRKISFKGRSHDGNRQET